MILTKMFINGGAPINVFSLVVKFVDHRMQQHLVTVGGASWATLQHMFISLISKVWVDT